MGNFTQNSSKYAWFDQGFALLRKKGAAGLTIENLARAVQRTKGSFYHHFKNREDYFRQLLEVWEERQANEIIRISKQGTTFEEINQTLVDLSEKAMDPKIEVAIRAWALRDPMVRAYQERIDRHRTAFLEELFSLMTQNKTHASLFAMIRYCFYIGSHQIIPAMDDPLYKTRLGELTRMFALYTENP